MRDGVRVDLLGSGDELVCFRATCHSGPQCASAIQSSRREVQSQKVSHKKNSLLQGTGQGTGTEKGTECRVATTRDVEFDAGSGMRMQYASYDVLFPNPCE